MSNALPELAAAAAAEQLVADEAGLQVPSGTGEETVVVAPPVDFPEYEVALPPELLAELETPDIEDVTDDEIEALVEEHGEENRELAARLLRAEKQAKHFEQLRQREAKKNWEEEAKKFFPLSEPFLENINSTSRRGYLRTAKDLHDRVLPKFQAAAKAYAEAQAGVTQETVAAAKAEAKKAWGQVVTDDGTPSVSAVTPSPVPHPRRRGDLADTIRNMVFTREAQ